MNGIKLPSVFRNNPNLHAYLVVSADKAVRENTARHIAAAMLCRNPSQDSDICGECDCCIKCKAGTHPDCIVLPNGDKTKVEDIRGIEDEAHLSTNEADAKVFILCDANLYNTSSQNAMLKIIEEPPKGVKFILTASSKQALLPTVRSRVCMISLEARSFDSILDEVRSHKKGIDEKLARRIASLVSAYDRLDACEMSEKVFISCVEAAVDIFSSRAQDVENVLPKGKEELILCLQVFMQASREIALAKCNGRAQDGMLDRDEVSLCASKCSMKRLHSFYDIFEQAYLMASDHANASALRAFILQNIR